MFILSELSIAQKLFESIHETLSLMHKAAKDIRSLTKESMAFLVTICENQVPLRWRQMWSGPRLLVDYLKAAASRGVAAKARCKLVQENAFDANIDFSHVFSVETLLAALKLKNAR